MTRHILDWSHAFAHRLEGAGFESSSRRPALKAALGTLESERAAGRLPFLNLPFADDLRRDLPPLLERLTRFRHMLVLGIGGSALGARALQKAFFPDQDLPGHDGRRVWIADNVDAFTLEAWLDRLPLAETCVVVISKSGGTIETMAQYFLVRERLQKALGAAWMDGLVLITDAGKGPLREEAARLGAASLPVPDYLGGRYSVFSAVGLVPAGFMGMDWQALLAGAEQAGARAARPDSAAARLALWNVELMAAGYSQLIFFSYVPLWNYLGAWFSQLWAESLGKAGKGSQPVPAVGVTDQHSINQMFLDGPRDKGCIFLTAPGLPKGPAFGADLPEAWSYLAGKRFGDLLDAEALGTRMALIRHQVPLVHAVFGDTGEEAAGRFMGLCMAATYLTGLLLGLNPLDQPAVELGKRLADSALGFAGHAEERAALAAFTAQAPGLVSEL